VKQERTKEHILELRKKMMKSKVKPGKDNFRGAESVDPKGGDALESDRKAKKVDPNQELMLRLAMGKKVTVIIPKAKEFRWTRRK
jgi:hypothetical protein